MRMLGTLIISLLCAGATGTPVCALEELQDCDAIKDTGNRMACLQAHISHLEQTLLSISTELVDIRHELKVKLATDEVYKLQYVGKGSCLGFADNDKPPVFATCDRPEFLEARARIAVAGEDNQRAKARVRSSRTIIRQSARTTIR